MKKIKLMSINFNRLSMALISIQSSLVKIIKYSLTSICPKKRRRGDKAFIDWGENSIKLDDDDDDVKFHSKFILNIFFCLLMNSSVGNSYCV
jgi:hypothetical protein